VPELVLHRADGSSKSYPFTQGPVSFGRGATSHVRFNDEYVSRVHCEVSLRGDQVVLHDLNSHNGTYVNGERLTEKVLVSGDKVQLGETQLTFQLVGKVAAPEKPGEPPRKDFDAVFTMTPLLGKAPTPSDTVRIPLPPAPSAKL
jgi:pSer/pThr/pTyr-binding forkhead associated (FHA) protein